MRNIKGSSIGWTETTPVGNFNLQEGLKVPEMIKKGIFSFVFPNFSERCLTKAKSTAMYCKIYNIVKYMKTKSSKINNLRSKHNINRQKKIENRKKFVEVKRKFFKLSWFLKGLLKLIYTNNTNLGGKSTKYKYTK